MTSPNALLPYAEAVVSGEPGQTLARDDLRGALRHERRLPHSLP